MDRKTFPFLLKHVDGAARKIEGYAAVFHNIDEQGDIIEPGAFAKTLLEDRDDIQVLLGHEWRGLPVGTPEKIAEDTHGLLTVTEMFDTSDGRDIVQVAERFEANPKGPSLGMSIGYRATDTEIDEVDGQEVFRLKEIKLFEYSFVSLPANPLATVTGVKEHADLPSDIKEINMLLARLGVKALTHERLNELHSRRRAAGLTKNLTDDEWEQAVKDYLFEIEQERKRAPVYRLRAASVDLAERSAV